MTATRQRTVYATFQQAQADGWRRIDHKTDRDISGGDSFGYKYESPDGHTSTTIIFTKECNKMEFPGCCVQMFRDSNP